MEADGPGAKRTRPRDFVTSQRAIGVHSRYVMPCPTRDLSVGVGRERARRRSQRVSAEERAQSRYGHGGDNLVTTYPQLLRPWAGFTRQGGGRRPGWRYSCSPLSERACAGRRVDVAGPAWPLTSEGQGRSIPIVPG
jgi:hypothetical protein